MQTFEIIRDFINHCAVEGIGETQQQRHIYSLKTLLTNFAPEEFRLAGATKNELKQIIAAVNRSDYADATKRKFKISVKKFYRVQNGESHPDKVEFFSAGKIKPTSVKREDLFTEDELKRFFSSFDSIRDRAAVMVLYGSASRPGELLTCNIADFQSNEKSDFVCWKDSKAHGPNQPACINPDVAAGIALWCDGTIGQVQEIYIRIIQYVD